MVAKLLKAKDFIAEKIIWAFLSLFGLWLLFALSLMFYSMYLEFTGNDQALQQMSNEFSWKFDGTFKNSPDNIWYEAEDHIWVESVTNEVKIGKLAGNRKLEFGVKNILEEYLQERGLDLSPDATQKLKVSIIFLDVLTTKKNISIFHSGEEEVVIRLKGTLYKDGKKDKEVIVEESSSEISMSTLIVDEGGKFNQTSLSNALKKGSDKLITKLLGEKK